MKGRVCTERHGSLEEARGVEEAEIRPSERSDGLEVEEVDAVEDGDPGDLVGGGSHDFRC